MGTGSIEVNELNIDLMKEIKPVMLQAGKDTVEDLKATSPKQAGGGAYARGWTMTQTVEGVVVHNKGKDKTLGHLLELRHDLVRYKNEAKVKYGHVFPQEHIRPAYDRQKQKYLDELSKVKIKSL